MTHIIKYLQVYWVFIYKYTVYTNEKDKHISPMLEGISLAYF